MSYPLGSYTQNAGEDTQYLAQMEVSFSANCEAPREATILLFKDSPDPTKIELNNLVGLGVFDDETTGGEITRRLEFGAFPIPGAAPMADLAPTAATPHKFDFLIEKVKCKSGSGATILGAGLDVIGTRSSMRPRLTYANVMTTIAVFLALSGATAFAATQLAKKSVGTKQLKANAVTTAKIKKNAVTKAKIKAKAVDGTKIVDGSVTGADINAAATNFGRRIASFRSTAQAPFVEDAFYPLGNATYTQNAGEDNLFIGHLEVNFLPGCEAPRHVQALLVLDVPDPSKLEIANIAGYGKASDETGTGTVSKRMEFQPYIGTPMGRFAPAATAAHTFSVLPVNEDCKSGSGVTVTGAAIDVLGVK